VGQTIDRCTAFFEDRGWNYEIILANDGSSDSSWDVFRSEVAARHGLAVVEDNAHGLCGKYKDKYLGTFGSFATQRFHSRKRRRCALPNICANTSFLNTRNPIAFLVRSSQPSAGVLR
jgi:glycosyltransferase involved in cell wall biosynthesis